EYTCFLSSVPGRAVGLQSDGRIVVVGTHELTTACGGGSKIILRRTNQNGTPAGFFGGMDNVFRVDRANDLAVQPDDKIVVVGSHRDPNPSCSGCDTDFLVLRLNADLSLDTGFGSGGIVFTDFAGGDDAVTAVALETGGRLVAAGVSGGDFAVARYQTD